MPIAGRSLPTRLPGGFGGTRVGPFIGPAVRAGQPSSSRNLLMFTRRQAPPRTRVLVRRFVSFGGTTFNQTVSATQAQSVALSKTVTLIRADSQAQSVALVKTVNMVRSDTQSQVVALSKTAQLARSVTQAQSASVTALKVLLRTVTATQAQALALLKTIQLIRSDSQGQSVVVQQSVRLTRSMTQSQSAALAKQANLTRASTQAQTISLTTLKVILRTVSATQAQVVSLAKSIALSRSAVQPQSVALSKSLTLTRSLTQGQAAFRTIAARLARIATQAQSAVVNVLYLPGGAPAAPAAYTVSAHALFSYTVSSSVGEIIIGEPLSLAVAVEQLDPVTGAFVLDGSGNHIRIDDATMAVTVYKPDGTSATPTVTHVALGEYTAEVTPDQSGYWQFAFQGTSSAPGRGRGRFWVAPVP